mgnify:CR=1 FL=1
MALLNTYVTLTDVRRQLRAVPPSGRIRFSESFNVLKKHNDNTGTIELNSIGISTEYSDVANYKFTFSGDSSSFSMYKIDNDKFTNVFLGNGYKQNNFTSNDGYFTIDSTSWTGWVFPQDVIEFSTDSHVSINDGTRFIQDAELFVDSILEKNIRFSSTSESLRFDSTNVPKSIKLASQKIGSYFLYKAVYLENNNEKTTDNIAIGWLKEGLELIASYVDKWNLALSTSAPVLGHAGSNQPVDLDNDFVFKSSQFNLRIPLDFPFYNYNDYFQNQKAYNLLTSNNYLESLVSDISFLSSY